METYTQLTRWLQDNNQEIRQRHSSMLSSMEQEMQKLELSLVEIDQMEKTLKNDFSIVLQHLQILEKESLELLRLVRSRVLTEGISG